MNYRNNKEVSEKVLEEVSEEVSEEVLNEVEEMTSLCVTKLLDSRVKYDMPEYQEGYIDEEFDTLDSILLYFWENLSVQALDYYGDADFFLEGEIPENFEELIIARRAIVKTYYSVMEERRKYLISEDMRNEMAMDSGIDTLEVIDRCLASLDTIEHLYD